MKLGKLPPAHVTDALIKELVARLEAIRQGDVGMDSLTWDDIHQALRTLERPLPRDWLAMQGKQQAAVIRREITARADELRRRGVRKPVAQAEAEIAERLGHTSGSSLNRWLRRHR